MSNDRTYGCPVDCSLDLLGGKWKPVILARLKERPMRYGELRRVIPELSDKVLAQRLYERIENELVTTTSDDDSRSSRLTSRGKTLRPILQSLYDWGLDVASERHVRLR